MDLSLAVGLQQATRATREHLHGTVRPTSRELEAAHRVSHASRLRFALAHGLRGAAGVIEPPRPCVSLQAP